jgi:hypothetical protein
MNIIILNKKNPPEGHDIIEINPFIILLLISYYTIFKLDSIRNLKKG